MAEPERPDWMRRPPAPEPAPPKPLAPSRAGSEPPARSPLAAIPGAPGEAAAARGRVIHKVLKLLPDLPPERRPEAARRFLARPALDLSAASQAELAESVLALLAEPGFAPLFAPGNRAEVPITGLVQGRAPTVLSGQIDRLTDTGAEVLAVDYKTGQTPPATVAETPVAYLRQMAAYRAGLVEIFPGRTVVCALLWTEAPRLDRLPDALLDGWAP
jgi:ATP-dependent helicase/nuclease subunit A